MKIKQNMAVLRKGARSNVDLKDKARLLIPRDERHRLIIRGQRHYKRKTQWSVAEHEAVVDGMLLLGSGKWTRIRNLRPELRHRSTQEVRDKARRIWPTLTEEQRTRIANRTGEEPVSTEFTITEDHMLVRAIAKHGLEFDKMLHDKALYFDPTITVQALQVRVIQLFPGLIRRVHGLDGNSFSVVFLNIKS
jgi:hypothetical protein